LRISSCAWSVTCPLVASWRSAAAISATASTNALTLGYRSAGDLDSARPMTPSHSGDSPGRSPVGRIVSAVQRRVADRIGGLGFERKHSRQALEGDHRERVEIRRGGGRRAGDLLGRPVGGSAETLGGGGLAGRAGEKGDAEVGELHAPVVAEQDVLALHVAVEDASIVRGGQRRADSHEDRARAPLLQRTLGQRLLEGAALDELHDQERVLGAVELVEHADIGVLERGNGLGLGQNCRRAA
jgi:hypothetical protein